MEIKTNKHLNDLTTVEVLELQTLLRGGGYSVGTLDGVMGPKTTTAFAEFKKDHHLEYPFTLGPSTLEKLYQVCNISSGAIELIKEYEGFRIRAYICPAGVPTIGYGTTIYPSGEKVSLGDVITKPQAERCLQHYVDSRILPVLSKTIPFWSEMNPNQRGALISFAYNLGENFYGAHGFETITRVLKNRLWDQVPKALMLYVNPGSSFEAGLRRRRAQEGDLWRGSTS